MKHIPTTLVLLALAFTALVAQAQTNYTIDWFTIDGGGGTSTGGVYTVSGIPLCGTSRMPAR